MGATIFIILLLMVPIGIIQIISAVVITLSSEKKHMKEHFISYLIGVMGYFSLLTMLWSVVDFIGITYLVSFFFLGSFGLMVYHISIFFRRNSPDRAHY